MEQSGVFLRITTISAVLALLFMPSLGFCLDPSKYITVDEVKTDMEAYCLTVYSGVKIERFELEILSVVKNHTAGRDMILVKGLDERFKLSGAVHGCSGSPVFIEGRLAGALAAGWDGSLEPLYFVRPIAEMHQTGSVENSDTQVNRGTMVSGYDYSQPIDLEAFLRDNLDYIEQQQSQPKMALPLAMALPDEVCEKNRQMFQKMGFIPFSTSGDIPAQVKSDMQFELGGTLALVLCGGDIPMSSIGTVTEIDGDQVYGFGHGFMGQGPVNLPMAPGFIHTVVAHRQSSFKYGTAGPVLGTLEFDHAASVRGTIGKIPPTIPLKINVKRYNDPEDRVYNCFLAIERNYTPRVLMMAITGAGQMQAEFPPEHTISYQGRIAVRGFEPLQIQNISSGAELREAALEMSSAVGMLLNNPFEEVVIESIEIDFQIGPEDKLSNIWSAGVSQVAAKPGQTLSASVVLNSRRSEETKVDISIDIPEGLAKGKYSLLILGASQYQQFVSKMAPQRLLAVDLNTLHDALQRTFDIPRNRLYCVMQVPATGLVMRQYELADLPPTKMILMQDSKRIAPVQAYNNWIENSIGIDRIVEGTVEIELTVE